LWSLKVKDSGVLTEEKKKGRVSIPEIYGMVYCSNCNGLGKFVTNANELNVCITCGGFGAIRMPEVEVIHTHRIMERWENVILD
jgi:DnaJ-class molecular chaperone